MPEAMKPPRETELRFSYGVRYLIPAFCGKVASQPHFMRMLLCLVLKNPQRTLRFAAEPPNSPSSAAPHPPHLRPWFRRERIFLPQHFSQCSLLILCALRG